MDEKRKYIHLEDKVAFVCDDRGHYPEVLEGVIIHILQNSVIVKLNQRPKQDSLNLLLSGFAVVSIKKIFTLS